MKVIQLGAMPKVDEYKNSFTNKRYIKDPFISCVIPVYNEEENLKMLVPSLSKQLSKITKHYEIILIDDGSTDLSAEVAMDLSEKYFVRLIQLSRNFGKENALTAGLDYTQGDVVITLDADFQHPLTLIPIFYDFWSEGYDMVYGVRENRDDEKLWKRVITKGFYRLLALGSETPVEEGAGDFRLMDRSVVHALRSLPEKNRFMKGLYGWVGFKKIAVPYEVCPRKNGESKFSFLHLVKLAMKGITSFSTFPLHVWSAVGMLISLLSMVYGVFIATKTLFFGVELPGWATLAVGMTFLGGIQLLSVGILGEYIGRIFSEVKSRPAYIVSHHHNFDSVEVSALREHQL